MYLKATAKSLLDLGQSLSTIQKQNIIAQVNRMDHQKENPTHNLILKCSVYNRLIR